MVGSIRVIAKKIFSLSLVLNSLVTLASVAQIMFNYYRLFHIGSRIHPIFLTEVFSS